MQTRHFVDTLWLQQIFFHPLFSKSDDEAARLWEPIPATAPLSCGFTTKDTRLRESSLPKAAQEGPVREEA